MLERKTIIAGFIKWIAERYIALEKQVIPYSCKLNGLTIKNGKQVVLVNFSGNSYQVEIDPEIIVDSNLFEYFSPQDKKRIFAIVYQKKTSFKLVEHYYSRNNDKRQMIILQDSSNNRMTMAADEASQLIEKIDSADSFKIGFLAGIDYWNKTTHEHDSK